ncbi:MAG: carboxypeptidase-like regulatory domain-containing protein [Acidobacteriota bacterium]
MKPQGFDINNLRVASPCHVGWENMSGDERKRFCDSCSTDVYNISGLTALEVQQLITNRSGRLCIRLYRRADGTVLTKDCPVVFRAYQKRVTRFAGAALAAIFGLVSISFGQKNKKDEVRDETVQIVRSVVQNQQGFITGMIIDSNGAIIPGATLKLYSKGQKKPITMKSGDDGSYSFSNLAVGLYKLEIKYEGFTRHVLTNI